MYMYNNCIDVMHFTLYLCDSLVAGGTDIISCFAGQNPTVPVYRGEIQTRNLGMAMECWNQDGRN